MAVPEGYKSLGTVGIAYKGEYDSGTTYKYLNCVYYKGSTYVALKDSPEGEPQNNDADWRYLAEGVVGAAAGFGDITATVDETTGVPSVDVNAEGDNTSKNITFNFHGLKGEQGVQGEVGEAAGFGNITATIDNETGTPNVKVTKGDDNTAMDITFAFTGMKGETGEQGDQGVKGDPGVSVTGAEIREGHLYITLSEGEESDAGEIVITKEEIINSLAYTPEKQHTVQTGELTAASWTGDKSPYTYTLEISDLTATQTVYISAGNNLTEAQINAFTDACISGQTQSEGQVTLQAINKPTENLPIIIELGGEPTA